MKTKPFVVALLLALTMLLCACGGEPEDISGSVTPAPTAPADLPEEKPQEQPADEPTEAPMEENPVSLGRMEGGVYTNSYTGYGCTLDENWAFYTAEELQQLPENTQELFADTELGETTSQYTQITDMMAENATDFTSVNVLYTQIGLQERLAYAVLSEEEIMDASLAQMDAMIAAYEQAGISDAVIEKVTITFLGEDRVALKTSANIDGVPYYILQVQDYKLGAYGVTLTASSFLEDNTQAVLDLFYAVD